MKQETINLIKSMTEQGFLVVVDPEKLKGDGAVMVEVMKWKENKNGVEVTLTAEEPKPEPKVIFTNCVGEVFTEEDFLNNVNVWFCRSNCKIENMPTTKLDEDEFAKGAETTDIFRSKKSLLKYLYETCD